MDRKEKQETHLTFFFFFYFYLRLFVFFKEQQIRTSRLSAYKALKRRNKTCHNTSHRGHQNMSAISEVFKNGLFLRSSEFWKLKRVCEKAGVTGERREGKGALLLWASLLTQEKAERLRFYGKEQGKEGGRERKKREGEKTSVKWRAEASVPWHCLKVLVLVQLVRVGNDTMLWNLDVRVELHCISVCEESGRWYSPPAEAGIFPSHRNGPWNGYGQLLVHWISECGFKTDDNCCKVLRSLK